MCFFFSSRRRHTRFTSDWSSDVCSSDLVFEISWLIGSVVWFIAIGFGILFVIQKTRLGYLIAGVLSWVTIAFWLFDNFYVVFDLSLIAQEPNIYMTLRNFLGVMIAGIAVFSSHNVFHKIRKIGRASCRERV